MQDPWNYVCISIYLNFSTQLKISVTVHVWKEGGWQSELDSITKSGHEAIFYSCWYLNYIKYAEDWIDFYRCDPGSFSSEFHFIMDEANDNSNFASFCREWNTIGAVQGWRCRHVEWICRWNEFNLKVMVGATWLLKQTLFTGLVGLPWENAYGARLQLLMWTIWGQEFLPTHVGFGR